ncbi:Yip1 family protein [Pseudomonadota bacterium]
MTTKINQLKLPHFNFKKLDFQGAFKKLIDLIKLDKKAIAAVSSSDKFTTPALIFLVIGSIAGPVGGMFHVSQTISLVGNAAYSSFVASAVIGVIVSALAIYIASFVAVKLFNGKGTFEEFFRVIGLCMGVKILDFFVAFIPVIAGIVSLVILVWLIVIIFITIKDIFKLDEANTVLTMLVAGVIVLVIGGILSATNVPVRSANLGPISITY